MIVRGDLLDINIARGTSDCFNLHVIKRIEISYGESIVDAGVVVDQ